MKKIEITPSNIEELINNKYLYAVVLKKDHGFYTSYKSKVAAFAALQNDAYKYLFEVVRLTGDFTLDQLR